MKRDEVRFEHKAKMDDLQFQYRKDQDKLKAKYQEDKDRAANEQKERMHQDSMVQRSIQFNKTHDLKKKEMVLKYRNKP